MNDLGFLILVIGCLIVMAVYYCKIVLVYRDVMLKKAKRMENEFRQVNELYLLIVNKCNEMPIENVTLKQAQNRIKKYFKNEYTR